MKTSFKNSSNAEISGITINVMNVTKDSRVAGITENLLFKLLQEAHAPFHNLVLREKSMKLGNKIKKLHSQRMILANALRNTLIHYTKFSNTERAASAEAILKEWNMIKSVSRNDTDETNAYMDKLTVLLKQEAIKAHFTDIFLADAAADVESANKAFLDLYKKQSKGISDMRYEGAATQYRPQLDKALGNFLRYITIMKEQPEYVLLYINLKEAVKTATRPSKKSSKTESNRETESLKTDE